MHENKYLLLIDLNFSGIWNVKADFGSTLRSILCLYLKILRLNDWSDGTSASKTVSTSFVILLIIWDGFSVVFFAKFLIFWRTSGIFPPTGSGEWLCKSLLIHQLARALHCNAFFSAHTQYLLFFTIFSLWNMYPFIDSLTYPLLDGISLTSISETIRIFSYLNKLSADQTGKCIYYLRVNQF
jgi:hypothetical protein